MASWEGRAVWIIGECFTDEETGSERLSDCPGLHSNLRAQCGRTGALDFQSRNGSIRSFVSPSG